MTLVQIVTPAGTVEIVQLPVEVGAAAFVGPVTVAVNTTVLARAAVDTFAVTDGVTVTGFTCVGCVVLAEVKE